MCNHRVSFTAYANAVYTSVKKRKALAATEFTCKTCGATVYAPNPSRLQKVVQTISVIYTRWCLWIYPFAVIIPGVIFEEYPRKIVAVIFVALALMVLLSEYIFYRKTQFKESTLPDTDLD